MQRCPACNYISEDQISVCPVCGTIPGSQKQIGKEHILSNVVSIVLFALIVAYMSYSSYSKIEPFEKRQAANLLTTDIKILSKNIVNRIVLQQIHVYSKNKITCLAKPYQDEFINIASKMIPTQYYGMRMNIYQFIDIDAGSVGKFGLNIYTRGRDAHAEFYKCGEQDQKVVYDAGELYEWLEELPVSAFKDSSDGSFK